MTDSHLVEVATQREQLVKGNFLDVRRDTIRRARSAIKNAEIERFQADVSDWEQREYFEMF